MAGENQLDFPFTSIKAEKSLVVICRVETTSASTKVDDFSLHYGMTNVVFVQLKARYACSLDCWCDFMYPGGEPTQSLTVI